MGGEKLRLRLSNEYSSSPLTIKLAHIANAVSGSSIDVASSKALTFMGKTDVTIPAKGAVLSDALPFDLPARARLAITLQFANVPQDITGHPGSRTASYIQTGSAVASANLTSATKTEHWYVISALDVEAADKSGAVAILGDSITDGRGSGTDKHNRWPDELARRLQTMVNTQDVGVLNHGVGGNCVLKACLGPAGNQRFDQDILQQTGVQWMVILEGVNDLGNSANASNTANDLISNFGQMVDKAHSKGLLAYGATILPFGGSSYDNADREAARKKINNWIRSSGKFDAVIDFDAAMRDPNNPSRLLSSVDSGDHLHPNENGYRVMAEAIDLKLFY